MSQPATQPNRRTIYREKSPRGALWQPVAQFNIVARFLSAKKKSWNWVFAALLTLAIHAPARADRPCSGGDDHVARPIAATLQPNASAFDPNGRFEVTLQSSANLTTDIYVRHSVGSRELFRAITRLQSDLHSVVVGRLPAREGLGFSLQVAEGGSGYREVCTYGFRFQHGVVFYRTLAASGEDTRGGGIFAGDVTDWKSVSKPPALVSQSTQAQSVKGGAYIDYWVDVAAREAPDITRRFIDEGLSTVTTGLVSDTILALGSTMPEEMARTLTLTPRGFLGWTARIISKETTKDLFRATPIGPAMKGLVIGVIVEALVDGIREKCPCPTLDNYYSIEGLVWLLRQTAVAYALKTAGMHGAITAEAIITVVTLGEAAKEGIKLGSDLRKEEESKILFAVMQRVTDFSKEIKTETDPQLRAEKLQSLDNYLRHEQTRLPGMAAQFDAWRQKLVANLAQVISLREITSAVSAGAAGPMQITPVGLGAARFGMTPEAIEQVLGQKLSFPPNVLRTGLRKVPCVSAKVAGLSGVGLVFEHGRLLAVTVLEPAIATNVGVKVGDHESVVIAKLRSDPTYERSASQYDDKTMEITVGKAAYVGGPDHGGWQGRVMKFVSTGGVVRAIEAGEARYVMLAEHQGCE